MQNSSIFSRFQSFSREDKTDSLLLVERPYRGSRMMHDMRDLTLVYTIRVAIKLYLPSWHYLAPESRTCPIFERDFKNTCSKH